MTISMSLKWAVLSMAFAAFDSRAADPVNVVLIISDDHAAADHGFMGHPTVKTPHLDRLAARSLCFPRGYVASSLCCPSLASIITGKFPHQTGIVSNDPPRTAKRARGDFRSDPGYREGRRWMNDIMTRQQTLPRLLAERGYVSLQTGKWWHGSYEVGGFTEGMTHGDPDRGGRHGDAGLDIGRKTMEPILRFIRRSKESGAPFFIWYAPMMPHQPHNPPQRLLDKYAATTPSPHVARYWAMIEWFDETCGQLLNAVESEGLTERTLFVYLADNGWIQDPNSPQPLRSKRTHYDAGHRTPILFSLPGKIEPRRADSLASGVDIVPTILAALGVQAPAGLPGINLLDPAAAAARKAVFGECFTHDAVDLSQPQSSLRYRWIVRGQWRLAVPNPAVEPDAHVELYDLETDPGEVRNVASEHPQLVAELTRELANWQRVPIEPARK